MVKLKIEGMDLEIETKDEEIVVSDLIKYVSDKHKGYIMAAKVKNKLLSLDEKVKNGDYISFIDTFDEDGQRIYFRVLSFIFIIACRKIFENVNISAQHSLSDGIYYTLDIGRTITDNDILDIKRKMKNIIDEDCSIRKIEIPKKDVESIFYILGRDEKAEIIDKKDSNTAKVYECEGNINYFYGMMLPSTGYIKVFDLIKYKDGVVIMGHDRSDKNRPLEFNDQPKLSEIYNEAEKWSETIGINTVRDLNRIIENKEYGEIIRIVEALQEKKISQIADEIKERNSKIVLIAAPSSSGKTSFAHRLSIQLKVNGLSSKSIGIDDYFVDRENTPRNSDGSYDYESIKAVDIERFNKDINSLLSGGCVERIRFDFKEGKRIYTGENISLRESEILVIEGIHGLNPELTKYIPSDKKFKIYISALTQVNLDYLNRIPTTDLRLIRRIVRDNNFRGYSAEDTINGWKSVRNGEEKNIFPYQEEADAMFNSACVYELSVLKKYAYPLLKDVDKDSNAHIEATRIMSFLQYFSTLEDTSDIPPTAIIREFIGGSRIV